MALMIGAMIIQGIQPGPSVMTEQPALFWGIIASMDRQPDAARPQPAADRAVVKMISVPYHLLYPMILVFCCIGVFSLNNSGFDVYLMMFFGFLGYVFKKLDCEPAPMLLGFILGPMMEEFLRRCCSRRATRPSWSRGRSAPRCSLCRLSCWRWCSCRPSVKTREAFQED